MNLLETWTIQSNAKKDAKAGVESGDDLIKSLLGERPVFDPSCHDHGRIAADLNSDATISGLEAEAARLEDEKADHPSRLGLECGLVLLYLTEALACVNLMKSLGFGNPVERTLIGMMLAAFIFWVTAMAAEARGRGRYLIYPVYVALVIAVAATRLADSTSTSGGEWAEAAVLMAATVGPAWLAERLWRLRAPAAKLGRQIANLRRRLRDANNRRDCAQRFVDRLNQAQRRWDNDATIIRSTYAKEHRRKSAMSPGAWPVHGPLGTN